MFAVDDVQLLVMRMLMVDHVRRLTESEISLNAAKTEAEEANKAKSELLASMSHELRTPLNAILGFSEIIESQTFGPVLPKYAEYAHDIHSGGRHLLNLVNDILDLAKLDARKMELHETEFALQPLIEDCLGMLKMRASASGVTLSGACDFLRLRADELRVKQILLNLLSNAVKFTPSGGAVSVRAAMGSDGSISVSVMDAGIGMTGPEIAVAFSPFGQVDSKIVRTGEGTGLGLPICKSLMELHGGEIGIASTPQKGTTATIWFPAYRTAKAADARRAG